MEKKVHGGNAKQRAIQKRQERRAAKKARMLEGSGELRRAGSKWGAWPHPAPMHPCGNIGCDRCFHSTTLGRHSR